MTHQAPVILPIGAFYASTAEFITGVGAFIGQGLDQAEPTLIAAPGAAIRLLQQHLDGHGRQVSWADITQADANPARIISLIDAFASSQPGRRVRCVTQPLWHARTAEQRRETIRQRSPDQPRLPRYPGQDPVPLRRGTPRRRRRSDRRADPSGGHPERVRPAQSWLRLGHRAPPECDAPLDPAPADAAVLAYRDDLGTVRAFTAGHASKAGAAPGRAGDLIIAISELAANTYRHTAADGTLAIWATADELICQVQDTGHITNPLAGRRRRAPDAGGGQGMWVAHQLCDLVEIRSSPAGTQIRVHIQLRRAGRPAALPPLAIISGGNSSDDAGIHREHIGGADQRQELQDNPRRCCQRQITASPQGQLPYPQQPGHGTAVDETQPCQINDNAPPAPSNRAQRRHELVSVYRVQLPAQPDHNKVAAFPVTQLDARHGETPSWPSARAGSRPKRQKDTTGTRYPAAPPPISQPMTPEATARASPPTDCHRPYRGAALQGHRAGGTSPPG